MKQRILRPGDVVVLAAMAIESHGGFARIAAGAGRSIGETHGAVQRLISAGLLDADSKRPILDVVLPFLEWGVPFAYPADVVAPTLGLPTAVLDPGGTGVRDQAAYVWPAATGTVVRDAIVPLHPRVPEIALASPPLWKALSLIDLLRVGATEDRAAAAAGLDALLRPGGHAA